jgi:hypothetical protein
MFARQAKYNRNLLVVLIAITFIVALPSIGLSEQDKIDQVVKVVADDWNSLEIVKLIIGLLTPMAMLFIGIWMDRRIKEVEHRQWSNQKIIEKRLDVYEKIAPHLNEMMCYYMRFGAGKEFGPEQIINMKRELDKIANIYAPLFSPKFISKYNAFMSKCFLTDRGAGLDAQLRSECIHYRDAYVGDDTPDCKWHDEWDDCFTGPEDAVEKTELFTAYKDLVGTTAAELGVGLETDGKD